MVITLIIVFMMLGTGIYFSAKKMEYIIPKQVKLGEPFTGQNKLKVIDGKCDSYLTGFSVDNSPYVSMVPNITIIMK